MFSAFGTFIFLLFTLLFFLSSLHVNKWLGSRTVTLPTDRTLVPIPVPLKQLSSNSRRGPGLGSYKMDWVKIVSFFAGSLVAAGVVTKKINK